MAKIYSHSRLSTFEQCPYRFKLKYIDKIVPEIEQSIEALLGSCVHETLEWMYLEVKQKRIPQIEQLIEKYATCWEENYKPEIVIVRENLTPKDYFNKGVQYLVSYYTKHKPFDDNTISVEEKIIINLDGEGNYKIQGFIDRLVYNLKTEEYEVHDYKTANSMPTKEKIENDRQLALYSIAIKEKFGQDKKVCLVWHYLAHNTKICSRKTNQQLEQLKKNTLEQIKKIEATKTFPYYISRLCDWCEYKDICPGWKDSNSARQKI